MTRYSRLMAAGGAHPVQILQALGVGGSPLPPAEPQRGDDVRHLARLLQHGRLGLLRLLLRAWSTAMKRKTPKTCDYGEATVSGSPSYALTMTFFMESL